MTHMITDVPGPKCVLLLPPLAGVGGDVVHELLVLLPVRRPLEVVVLRLTHTDAFQDLLVLTRHTQQFSLAFLSI